MTMSLVRVFIGLLVAARVGLRGSSSFLCRMRSCPWVSRTESIISGFGVILALAASVVGALGDNLVRYSRRENGLSSFLSKTIWIIGLLSTAIGNTALTLWALAYADTSLVAFRRCTCCICGHFAYFK